MCTHATRLEVLKRVPLFRDLTPGQLDAINREWVLAREYEAGEALYRAGDEADTLFVIATGKVKLLDYTSNGQQVVLDLLAPGESFGSLLALGDDTYANDAQAHTFCCVLTLSSDAFEDLLGRYPRMALAALRVTAGRLRDARRAVRELSALPVAGRIASVLLKLAEKVGEPHEGGVLLQVPLPQQDLAAMTGTTPESVSRNLGRLRRAGLLTTGRTWLVLKDIGRLEAVARGRAVEAAAP